jgi:Cu(I)/Ag(I) efflux system membrane fusion protein
MRILGIDPGLQTTGFGVVELGGDDKLVCLTCGAVKLSPGKIQRTGVKSESAAPRVIRTAVRVPGTIQLDERRISVISMRSESWVQRIADVTTGTRVSKGQPLMEIYSPLISSASAEYIATIHSKTTGGSEIYGRGSRQRLMNLDVPDVAIVEMENSGSVPIAIQWLAPRDGIVLERNAIEGMRAQPGDVLFRVADTSVVWALVDVAERDVGALSVGQPVVIRARITVTTSTIIWISIHTSVLSRI